MIVVSPAGMTQEKTFRLYLDTVEESDCCETLVCESAVENSWVLAPPSDQIEPSDAVIYPIASNDSKLPLRWNVYVVQQTPTLSEAHDLNDISTN